MEGNSTGAPEPELSLLIDDQVFRVKKELLVEYSDYFRAMFSGNYLETEQNEIKIDIVDASSMKILMQYMHIGLIDLSEFSMSVISDLTTAANFLQVTELLKQIEYTLEIQLSLSNWFETIAIAENAPFPKLLQYAISFGLYSFDQMKPNSIPSIGKLFWYLSHPYLNARSELDVFKFGYDWVLHAETGADAIMIILGSLDVTRLTTNELTEMKRIIKDYDSSLAARVLDCLHELSTVDENDISEELIIENKDTLCQIFTERVYTEVLNLVKESKPRKLKLIPAVSLWTLKDHKLEYLPHYMYMFDLESGFKKWLKVADKELWGWSTTSWGPWKLVVVGGEHGRGTGNFVRDVKIYDTLKNEWIQHGVQLPSRRHGGVTVLGDSLYIIGGVGGFRSVCLRYKGTEFSSKIGVVLDSAVVYNLKERTFRKIANLPDAIQSPAVCAHKGKIYAAGHNNVYRYVDLGNTDYWQRIVGTELRMSCLISFKDTIYSTQNYFSHLYAFNPDVDKSMEMITNFSNPPAAVCDVGPRLLFFTSNVCGVKGEILNNAEEYRGSSRDETPRIVWSQLGIDIKINDVAGSCSLIMEMAPFCRELSDYHKKYLDRYID